MFFFCLIPREKASDTRSLPYIPHSAGRPRPPESLHGSVLHELLASGRNFAHRYYPPTSPVTSRYKFNPHPYDTFASTIPQDTALILLS